MQTNDFEGSFLKEMVRQAFVKKAMEHHKYASSISYYGLPGSSFSCEAGLEKECIFAEKNLTMIGVEKNQAVYERGSRVLDDLRLPMDFYRMTDAKFWDSTEKKFNLLWFDFMGTYGSFATECLPRVLSGNHLLFDEGNPLIGLTVCVGRERRDMMGSDELVNLIVGGRELAIPKILNKVSKAHGYSLITKTVIRYHDKVRGNSAKPMIFFLFEVIPGRVRTPSKCEVYELGGEIRKYH